MKRTDKARLRRLLTYVGALIVFIAFFVREMMRETARDSLADFGAAQSLFLERLEIITSERTSLMAKGRFDDPVGRNVDETARSRRTMLIVRLSLLKEHVDNDHRMLKHFDSFTTSRVLLEVLDDSAHKIVVDLDEYITHPNKMIQDGGEDAVMKKLGKNIGAEEVAADKLSDNILTEVDSQIERNERELDGANSVAYVVFGLGWVVSLTGHLMGSDGDDSSDE